MEETTKDLTNQNAANQKALKGQNAPAAEPRKILAAFASVDGLNVDEHFGHARYWQIYDFSGDGEFVETLKMPPVCGGSCSDNFAPAYELLKDCAALFVAKIGEPAAAYMLSRGLKVYEAAGSVDKIALAIKERGLLNGQDI